MSMISKIFPLETEAFHREEPYCSCAVGDRVVRAAAVVFLAAVDILTLPFRAGFWVGKAICCPQQNEESSLSCEPLSLEEIKNQINEAQNLEQLIQGIQAAVNSSFFDLEDPFLELMRCVNAKEETLKENMTKEELEALPKKEMDALRGSLTAEQLTRYLQFAMLLSVVECNQLSIDVLELSMEDCKNLYPEDCQFAEVLENAFNGVLKIVAEISVSIKSVKGRNERIVFIDTSLWLGDGKQLIGVEKIMPQRWHDPLLNRISELLLSEGGRIDSLWIKAPSAINDFESFKPYIIRFGGQVLIQFDLDPLVADLNLQ